MTAFTMLGRTAMPAFLMPKTKGDEPAPAPPLVRDDSSDGQVTLIAREPRM